ncbi:MAG: FHA domain-containing protein [Thermoleophilia bacterium]|nr:FHA domain-containing protein [Thermoleophilia bacterium]
MYCPTCREPRGEGDRFCAQCGTPLLPDDEGAGQATGPLAVAVEETLEVQTGSRPVGPALAVLATGGRWGELYALAGERVTVGRSPASDVFLDDVTVSRHHAELLRDGDRVVLRDLGSLNGTYVNRRRIDVDEALTDGDELQIGKFRLVFVA